MHRTIVLRLAILLACAASAVADDSPWRLASSDAGSLTISRNGEAHWRGTIVHKPAEPDPSFLATPQISIEITYRDPEGDTPVPVVLGGGGTQEILPPLPLEVEGFDRVVLFARRTPYALANPEPTHRSLQYVLYFEGESVYATFSYDAGLTSNRSLDETYDAFSRKVHEALERRDAAAARGAFLAEEAIRFLSRTDALGAHHQLSIERVSVDAGQGLLQVFPAAGDAMTSAVPWSRIAVPAQPERPVRFEAVLRAAERRAFVDRIGEPESKPAAGAILRIDEPLHDGKKRVFEASADAEGKVVLEIAAFDNEMKKDFSVFYPRDRAMDHQPTFGQLLLRWGRPIESSLDTGVFPLPAFPDTDDDEAIQAALIEMLFAYHDPDVNQFRKGQRTASTEDLPFFAITLLKWRNLGGDVGARVSSGAIQRFRKTYARHADYFYFQKYILGGLDAAGVKAVLEKRAAEYGHYPPNRWTLEWADDLLAAISLAEMEKDPTHLALAETLADGLVERIRRQPEPSTFRRGVDEGWVAGDDKPTRPHAHVAVALARAHGHLKKDAYLAVAFDQAHHLMDGHGIEGEMRLARLEADAKDPRAFYPSQLASVGLAFEYLERHGEAGARCGKAAREIRTAFLRGLRTRADRLELRDLLEMIRFFFDYYPTGA